MLAHHSSIPMAADLLGPSPVPDDLLGLLRALELLPLRDWESELRNAADATLSSAVVVEGWMSSEMGNFWVKKLSWGSIYRRRLEAWLRVLEESQRRHHVAVMRERMFEKIVGARAVFPQESNEHLAFAALDDLAQRGNDATRACTDELARARRQDAVYMRDALEGGRCASRSRAKSRAKSRTKSKSKSPSRRKTRNT